MTTGRINQVTTLKKEKIASSRNRTQEERATVKSAFISFFRRQSFQENVASSPEDEVRKVVISKFDFVSADGGHVQNNECVGSNTVSVSCIGTICSKYPVYEFLFFFPRPSIEKYRFFKTDSLEEFHSNRSHKKGRILIQRLLPSVSYEPYS